MTHTINDTSSVRTINFYLYNFESASVVTLEPGAKRVTVQESELNSRTMEMFDRPVVYVSPSQRAQMPHSFSTLSGLSAFLDDCSFLVSKEFLPQDVTDAEKQNHHYDSKMAISLLEKACKNNFAFAVFTMGLFYETGKNVKVDEKKALSLYKKAANMGIAVAQCALGLRIFRYVPEGESYKASINRTQAVVWLERAAKRGFAEAQIALARAYEHGEFGHEHASLAYSWYQKAADQGHPEAQCTVANEYLIGGSDINLAFDFFQRSAHQGYAEAQIEVGNFYYYGKNGLVRNVPLARDWYTKAANQNNMTAQYYLGVTYEDEQDFVSAFNWYAQSANAGFAEAQYRLGTLYERGVCFKVELANAFACYQRAAGQGHLEAQMSLASCYHHGKGVPKNLREAMVWYQKAKEQGSAKAEASLAKMRADLEQDKKAAQAKLQSSFKAKFDAMLKPLEKEIPHYEALQDRWLRMMGSAFEIESYKRIKEIEESVKNGHPITGPLLNEMKSLADTFLAAVRDVAQTLKKAEKERARVERQAEKAEKRASRRLELASIPDAPVSTEPDSITRSVKAEQAKAAEAKEKRKSVTLERRLSRSFSRSSLKLDFQQTQEQLAKEKEKHELRKSQRLSKLYTKEELIAAGILPAENQTQPVKTYGRIASFEKGTQEIFEGKREAREYTQLVQDLLNEFADSADLKLFKKVRKFEKLKKGLGGLVGVDHLKPWERNGCRICSFRVSDAIPERIVFAWNKKEQKAYQVTFVNYHPK